MTTIELTKYERDNLYALLRAVSGHAGRSPMTAGNTGDWVMQVAFKLGFGGHDGKEEEGNPNSTGEDIASSARNLVPRGFA